MGLFDKLFGAKPSTPPAPQAAQQITPIPSPTSEPEKPLETLAVPPRRERSKPEQFQTGDEDNAALLNAISEIIQADNEETRTGLYAALLQSSLYLVSMPAPGEEQTSETEITLSEGQQLSLATIRDGEGKVYLPVFTDLARLVKSLPERARYVKLSTTTICKMFLQGDGEGIVINPAQAPTGIITRGEAIALATGAAPELDANGQLRVEVPQQMKIAIGKPDIEPAEGFIAAIRDEAAKHDIVREVHLFKAAVEDQQPRLMIGLYVTDGLLPDQMHPTFEAIGKAASDARGEGELFDMMPLNEQMIEAIRPLESVVYSKSQEV